MQKVIIEEEIQLLIREELQEEVPNEKGKYKDKKKGKVLVEKQVMKEIKDIKQEVQVCKTYGKNRTIITAQGQ